MRGRAGLSAALVSCIFGILLATPRVRAFGGEPTRAAGSASSGEGAPSAFAERWGSAAAERLLGSSAPDDRLRGVERLALARDRTTVERLARLLRPESPEGRDPRVRLLAVRALDGFIAYEPARAAVAKVLRTDPGDDAVARFARQTAAMVLARSGEPKAADELVFALRAGGAVGRAAREAVFAHPRLAAAALGRSEVFGPEVARAGGVLDASVAELYGVLGVSGAVRPLERVLADRAVESRTRAAAALGLARLGSRTPLEIARAWTRSADPSQEVDGVRVLVAARDAGAAEAVVKLLDERHAGAEARLLAFTLLPDLDEPSALELLAAAAARRVEDPAEPGDLELARLVARSRREAVLETLGRALGQPARGLEAARALAFARADAADRVLSRALGQPDARRWAVRAVAVRAWSRGVRPSGLMNAVRVLEDSQVPADRAAGAFARMLVAPTEDRLRSADPLIVRSASAALLVAGRAPVAAAIERLASEPDPTTRRALALALAAPGSADALSTETLTSWAESGDGLAPLAVRALGPRESRATRGRLDRWLAAPSPLLRAHAALALGQSPDASATVRLARAWRLEPDATVRRALARALTLRPDPERLAPLGAVSRLDPDPLARELATRALAQARPGERESVNPGAPEPDSCLDRAAWAQGPAPWVVTEAELALPIVGNPDGVAIVPGVCAGQGAFGLASEAAAGQGFVSMIQAKATGLGEVAGAAGDVGPSEGAPRADGPSFEEAIRRLGQIVEQLERGDLPLEASLKLFEEGMSLSRLSQEHLDRAERRIEELLGVEDGRAVVRPFEAKLDGG